jgi:prevent-host-death family protein
MTKQATIAELEKDLGHFLAEVEQGNEIVVCKENVPVAKISPISARKNTSRRGNAKGTIKILGDITGPCIPLEDWEMLKD